MFSSSGSGDDFGGMSSIIPGQSQDSEPLCSSMSYQNRVYGFGACFILGWTISGLSVFAVSTGNVLSFALLYTLGNICALGGTGFLQVLLLRPSAPSHGLALTAACCACSS